MNVFWREQPLNEEEAELYQLVLEAHAKSALRSNASAQAVILAAAGSQDYYKALAAGLMTLGGSHGPIEETVNFLRRLRRVEDPKFLVNDYLKRGSTIPGWGNSFAKGIPDAVWDRVDSHLQLLFADVHDKLRGVTEALHAAGKELYPNPSAYTAAAAIVLGLPAQVSAYLFVAGRLAAWTQVALDNLRKE